MKTIDITDIYPEFIKLVNKLDPKDIELLLEIARRFVREEEK